MAESAFGTEHAKDFPTADPMNPVVAPLPFLVFTHLYRHRSPAGKRMQDFTSPGKNEEQPASASTIQIARSRSFPKQCAGPGALPAR
jgi:hypothetical protein